MLNIFNLIKNENLKLSRRISTLIMLGILIFIVIVAGIIIKFESSHNKSSDWRANLIQANKSLEKSISISKADGQITENWKKELETNNYRLKHNIPPIKDNSLFGFMNGAASMISLIALFAIVLGGGIVASEFSEGTIKLLLIRPSKRWKILLAKYISVVTYILLMLTVLFVVSFILGGILFSFNGATQPFLKYNNGHIVEINMFIHILGSYGLKCVDLIMMVTLAFMISTVFRNSSLAIGLGVFLMFAGDILVLLLSRFSWCKYILFANTNLNQYIDGVPFIKGMTLSFSIIVLLVYFLIFNIISFVGFSKRDVAA